MDDTALANVLCSPEVQDWARRASLEGRKAMAKAEWGLRGSLGRRGRVSRGEEGRGRRGEGGEGKAEGDLLDDWRVRLLLEGAKGG
jgi:hypothetical protein